MRSAAAGTTSSFCTNFTPSATSCAQPWNAAGVHRADAGSACAPSPCARSGRRAAAATRNAASDQHDAQHHLEHVDDAHASGSSRRVGSRRAGAGPTPPGRGRRAGRVWRRDGAAPTSASDSPGSLAPGQGLATRAASTKSLRSGWPSNSSGSSSGSRCGMAVESRCRTSRASRARATRAPANTPVSGGQPRVDRAGRGCARAGARRRPAGGGEVAHDPEAVVELVDGATASRRRCSRARRGPCVSAATQPVGGHVDGDRAVRRRPRRASGPNARGDDAAGHARRQRSRPARRRRPRPLADGALRHRRRVGARGR